MTTPIGAQGHLGIVTEASFASGGTIADWQPINSADLTLSFANVYTDKIADTAEQLGGRKGNRVVTGGVEFGISPENPLEWFQCGIGQDTSPYYSTRPLKSLAIEIDKETDAILASGCMIGAMGISSSQGGELTCAVDIEAADLNDTTAGSPSYTSGDTPYLHYEANFELNGVADTSITAFGISINNNLNADIFGTSEIRTEIPAGKQVVTGSFTKLFDDVTERDAFLKAQVRTFKVQFVRDSKSFTIWCPRIRYDSRPAPLAGQSEYILETFNFTAFVDDPATENQIRISGDQT